MWSCMRMLFQCEEESVREYFLYVDNLIFQENKIKRTFRNINILGSKFLVKGAY